MAVYNLPMKIIVDPDVCIGCDMCKDVSEGAIGTEYGKGGKAAVNPDANMADKAVAANAKVAAESCPVQAITIK